MELTRSGSNLITVDEKDWSLRFGEPGRDRFTLQCAEDLFLVTGCCSINELSEQSALPSRLRPHVSEDGKEFSFDSKTVIPFGSEPSVARKYKMTDHVMHLTTDLIMRTSLGMTELNAGDFHIRGKIAKVLIFGSDGILREAEGNILYEESVPPLSVIFQSESGAMLELSTGEDVWRWSAAERLGGTSCFRIVKEEIGIRYTRELFHWIPQKDVQPPPGRVWRYNSLIAWSGAKASRSRRPSKPKAVLDCSTTDWGKGCCKESGEVCFAANGTVNILKKWLRSNLADLEKGDVLLLDNVSVGPCLSAAHQDRPGKKELLHWDLNALLEFKRWAEKQLDRFGASLKIIPAKNCPVRDFPSLLAR
ncbi:MAG: hypothetical protein IJW23_08985 [Lentisphaeria bacterium]|nr:hypothetical protein [Lentisphaeria bacterium]